MKITTKLMLLCILLVAIPGMIIGGQGYKTIDKSITTGIESRIKEQATQIALDSKTVYNIAQLKMNSDLVLAHQIFSEYGKPAMDQTGNMVLDDKYVVNGNFDIVDKVKSLVGGTCTIFQLKQFEGQKEKDITTKDWPYDKAMYRISTNVLKLDGTRAVGTILSKPVYDTIMQGKIFYGRAFVVNAWYQTAYEPIIDSKTNEIIGVLYVGVKEEDFQREILNNLAKQVVGQSGYIYVLDEKGNYILSKEKLRDGENIWNSTDANGNLFIQKIITTAKSLNEGQSAVEYYPWINKGETVAREKVAGISYMKEWGWIIGASSYRDDFKESADLLKNNMIILLIVILVGGMVAFMMARKISAPIKQLTQAGNKIANGDIEAQIPEINTNDEISDLGMTMNLLAGAVKFLKKESEGKVKTAIKSQGKASKKK